MFLSEPSSSQGDIRFRIFGFPVRVHPMFWVVTGILGIRSDGKVEPVNWLIWIGVVFVSILVHELGHAVLQRKFGGRPWITLYGLGGLASCADCDRRPRSQILISLAGPCAGFLFAGVVILVLYLTGHLVQFRWDWIPILYRGFQTPHVDRVIVDLLYVNIYWGLVNLLPIYPLDGGQIARQLFWIWQVPDGTRQSLKLSMVTAIAVAAYSIWSQDIYLAFMFGGLAYLSFQALQYRDRDWR
jgi:Zn-dependent protease